MASSPEKLVIGLDLGGTSMAAGLVDRQLDVTGRIEEETPTEKQETLLTNILAIIDRLRMSAGVPVAAIGCGIPSMIDRRRGRAVMSVNIPLKDFDFVDYIREKTGLPVFIDNDANVAALAEVRGGAAKGASEAILITIGTGIGGGIITGGRVYRGATGSAAELGHMVIEANGPRCQGACPNYGCFETMASGTALARYAAELALKHPDSGLGQAYTSGKALDGALVTEHARAGDGPARMALEKIGYYVGVGMTSLVNIFNPEVFIIGGGIMQAGDLILDPAIKVLAERGLRPNRDVVRVVTAAYGPDAGMVGAACLAFDELKDAEGS